MNWVKPRWPLTVEEMTFVEHKDDWVALNDGQENGWLDGVVEDGLKKVFPKFLMKV